MKNPSSRERYFARGYAQDAELILSLPFESKAEATLYVVEHRDYWRHWQPDSPLNYYVEHFDCNGKLVSAWMIH